MNKKKIKSHVFYTLMDLELLNSQSHDLRTNI
jgi:hypothetical protein